MKKATNNSKTIHQEKDNSVPFDKWLLGENIFCLLIYVYSVISLAQSLLIDDAHKLNWCNLAEIVVLSLLGLLQNKSTCTAFNDFLNVFNRYAPSTTIFTYAFFFIMEYIKTRLCLEQYEHKINLFTVIILALSVPALFAFVLYKYKTKYKT